MAVKDLIVGPYMDLIVCLDIRNQRRRFFVRFSVWSDMIRSDIEVWSGMILSESVTDLIVWFLDLGPFTKFNGPRSNNQTIRSYKIRTLILYDLLRSDKNRTEKRGLRNLTSHPTVRFLKDLAVHYDITVRLYKILYDNKILQESYSRIWCKISETAFFYTIWPELKRSDVCFFDLGSKLPRSKNQISDRTRWYKIYLMQDFLHDRIVRSNNIVYVYFFQDFIRFRLEDVSKNLARFWR